MLAAFIVGGRGLRNIRHSLVVFPPGEPLRKEVEEIDEGAWVLEEGVVR